MDDNLLIGIVSAILGVLVYLAAIAVAKRLYRHWRQRRTAAAPPEDRVISRTVVTFDDEQQMNEAIAAFDRGDISPLMRRANGR